jgi:hypothetical protein
MEERPYQERVNETPAYRSKAEVQIARLLDREGIAYKYERPMAVVDHGKTKIWYPDFYLSDFGMIIEYFGMNGDSGYRKRAEHKMEVYRETGIEGVFLAEESFKGDWPARIIGQIEGILQGRLDRFYGSGRRAAEAANQRVDGAPFSSRERPLEKAR